MYDVLKQHALESVWCAPGQDNQIILAAKRITRPGGELSAAPVMMRLITLPKNDRRYHVFQIGQVHPRVLGLLPRTPEWTVARWVSFSDAVENLPLFVDLYTDAGVHLPLHRTYYMYTDERALIFAVDVTSKSPIDYEKDQVYLRLYTNAYFESTQANGLANNTRTEGATVVNSGTILKLQNKVAFYRKQPGQVLCFVNGLLVEDLSPITAKVGDVIEYLYDASMKTVVDLPVRDMQTFTSQLDNCFKYLLHFAGTTDQIDYVDDVDLYVVQKTGDRVKGTLLHRNLARTLRMVTHRDYSLSVDVYSVIVTKLMDLLGQGQLDPLDFSVRLYIRNSGMIRPLTYENQRLFELYKLKDEEVVRAFLGVDSSMPYWRADVLENSAYTKMMRVPYKEAQDITLIEDCFGYNAISKKIGDTPTLPETLPTGKSIKIPPACMASGTMFEYDADGVLLDWHTNRNGDTYLVKDPATALVECIAGEGSWAPDVQEGSDNLIIPKTADYRVYMCYLIDGVPDRKWKDITGTDMYRIENGLLKWNNLEYDQYLQLRSNARFLCYDLEILPIAGTVYVDLTEHIGDVHRRMDLPLGDLDIWLNGKSLIEELDYFVDFPRVQIAAKEHLVQPAGSTPQKLTIRFTGFADKALKRRPVGDYGFVQYGFLSQNHRFNVRDDKVLRITVRGAYRDRSVLQFSEDHRGIEVMSSLNGSPYQIRDVIVPLTTFTQSDTYTLKDRAEIIDKAVEDYLTSRIPEPSSTSPSVIPKRYIVMSPFFTHIINDLNSGQFDRDQLESNLTDMDVMAMVEPYLPLLALDPLNPDYEIDYRFVLIHPTNLNRAIEVDLYGYQFVDRVNKLYGRGLIELSPHLTISLGGPA